ncbi:MAG: hypothetical protein AAB967_02225, partial [Patescibacteria group bacterium]
MDKKGLVLIEKRRKTKKGKDNSRLTWVFPGGTQPMFPTTGSEDSARFLKILEGLQDAGCTQLVSAHYKRSSDARDYADYAASITLNSVYPGTGGASGTFGPTRGRCRAAYAKTPAMPAVSVEDRYEGE